MDDGRLFLKGEWVETPRTAEVHAPWDGRLLCRVAQASETQAEAALAFAFDARARLQGQSTGARRAVLEGIAAGLLARARDFEELICQQAGKPRTLARTEVSRAIEVFRLAAAQLSHFGGRVVPVDFDAASAGLECEVRRFPAGVVVGIVPFNFPLNLGAHKVAPALAVGAPILVKPPPQAPSAQLLLAEVAQAAGADPAALQVLPCDNAVAEHLATSPRVRVLSFTGSARVGWHLKQKAPGRVVLELGGNAAVLVSADADLDWAAERCTAAGFGYAGQVCIKVQRIYVERPVYDAFLERFLAKVRTLHTGDPSRSSPRCAGQSLTMRAPSASRPGWRRRWRSGRGRWLAQSGRGACSPQRSSWTSRPRRRWRARRCSARWWRCGPWTPGRPGSRPSTARTTGFRRASSPAAWATSGPPSIGSRWVASSSTTRRASAATTTPTAA